MPVLSDECYAEFTWDGPPRTVLATGVEGVMAVHSLSKRSNLAGVRAGFYAGDPDLVRFLVDVRRHAGLMVPGPVQAGAVAAFGDDRHVDEQRRRYLERLGFLGDILEGIGLPATMPAGGFYLWVPVPPSVTGGGWALAETLALEGGLLVSPASCTAPAVPASSGWRWSSPWTASAWWRNACPAWSLSPPIDHATSRPPSGRPGQTGPGRNRESQG